MNATKRRERFRAILAGDRCVHPASVFDAISARIAEDLGCEVGIFAGSVAALAILGAPDIAVITLSEFVEQSRRICRAGDLPVMLDADHGYGNALSVRRTVEDCEAAGVAALTIEDTLLPRPYGPSDKMALISLEEGVGKMRAAVAARQDPSLVVIARSSAIGVSGLDDAILRMKAYAAAGVDAVFLTHVRDVATIEALTAAIRVPLLLGNADPQPADQAGLGRLGVKIALQGHAPHRAMVKTLYEAMKAMREGRPEAVEVASPALMNQVSRQADYNRWTADYLGGKG